ncbi:histidinol-phosphate transaminase [Sporosarcina sp. P37]|uniref:histidinol-phosphate transaminase n=1 Tax=unclassified Sporosarcina TaxID=2647733 RepID=UPI0009BE86E8|nr:MULTISPECIES: histidinol-phosphate transaminase [unclassified Sporosarcina]ARD49456.1 histidinol-phosphate transaminase [Sporosarcina sp. P33]ARK25932.1 histidinol-phosphate transaminase [Sporosarcina sp. P37]PID18248.1 histidinol-phosphate transaminase [Sporosarcina sp. P35]
MKWKSILHTMKPYTPGRSLEDVKRTYGLHEVHKLASNENPYGSSPEVAEYLRSKAAQFEIYPDGYTAGLRTKLAEFHQIDPNEILFGNGSDEIVTIISRALLQPGKNTVMASVTFPQYAHNAKIEGAEIREVSLLENGDHDLEGFLQASDEETAVIWVCNPNNPTGNLLSSEAIRDFLDRAPETALIVLDEAYFEYVTDPAQQDAIPWIHDYDNLIVLRTFSKAYGLASFRIGYGVTNEANISQLNKVRNPFNNSSLALAVAEAALSDQQFLQHCVTKNDEERARFMDYAKQHSLDIYPSATNFVLIAVPGDADEACENLLKNGFIVRSGNLLGTPGYIRVTIGTHEQNTGFFKAFDQLLTDK